MALELQKRNLDHFIRSMLAQGYVNEQFVHLQTMKKTNKPDFVVRAITLYCQAAQNLFTQMSYLLAQNEVNFYQIEVHARDMYDRTGSIGVQQVKMACADIVDACQKNDSAHCLQALNWTKREFTTMRMNFETLIPMEKRIIELEGGI